MTVDADDLYRVVSTNKSICDKTDAVSALKAEVKRAYVDLSSVYRYFEALSLAMNTADPVLQAMSFSCMCHLVKRVITQDPSVLRDPSPIVLPIITNKLGDAKQSVQATAIRVMEDYWMACPAETEQILKEDGLCHKNPQVRYQCVELLVRRIQLQEGKFAFRPFTSRVVSLLKDDDTTIRESTYDLLSSFFKTSHIKAKQDLYKEMARHSIPTTTAQSLLKDIGLDMHYPPQRSTSSSSTMHTSRPASVLSQRPLVSSHSIGTQSAPTHTTRRSTGDTTGHSVFSIAFITESSDYQIEYCKPENVRSSESFKHEIDQMLPAFDGKETEHNWSAREKSIIRMRGLIRGNIVNFGTENIIWMLRTMSDGINKAMSSLRTSLAIHGFKLVRETAILYPNIFDSVVEPYLGTLIKITAGAKKITAQLAYTAINAMIINSGFSMKYLNHIQLLMNDKVAQPKAYAAIWLRLLMSCHRTHKAHFDTTGADQVMEKCIVKGIEDANPAVREAMRITFWCYHAIWTRQADMILNRLDATTRKHLEKANPGYAADGASSAPVKASASSATRFVRAPALDPSAKSQSGNSRPQTPVPRLPDTPVTVRQPRGLDTELQTAEPEHEEEQSTGSDSPHIPSTRAAETTDSRANTMSTHTEPIPTSTILDISAAPSLSELLQSLNMDTFSKGMKILSYVVRGREPPLSYWCARPVSLPNEDTITEVVAKVFETRYDGGAYQYSRLINIYCDSDMIGSTIKFIDKKDLILSAYFCVEDLAFDAFLQGLESVLTRDEGFEALVYLVDSQSADGELIRFQVMLKCISLLKKLSAGLTAVEEIAGQFNALELAAARFLSLDMEELHSGIFETLEAMKKEYASLQLRFVTMDNSSSEEILENEPQAADSTDVVSLDEDGAQSEGDNTENHSDMEEDEDTRPLVESGGVEVPSDLESQNLSVNVSMMVDHTDNDAATEAKDTGTAEDQYISNKSSADIGDVSATDASVQSDNERDEHDIEVLSPQPVVDTSSMSDLNENVSKKLTIFEDPDTSDVSNTSRNSRTMNGNSLISTPLKNMLESINPQQKSWFNLEMKKENCLTPLPEKASEASRLFDSLLLELPQHSIDAHGFRKLLTIVKGAKLRYNESPAYETWVRENRSTELQSHLLKYLNDAEHLDESQMNLGLLLLSQLLIVEGDKFAGLEKKTFESLFNIRKATASPFIGFGALAETRDLLVNITLKSSRSRTNLLGGILEMNSKQAQSQAQAQAPNDTSADSKIFLTKTLSMLLNPAHMTAENVADNMPALAALIHEYIADRQPAVRRDIYPVINSLQQIVQENEELNAHLSETVLSGLSRGQLQLLEHYSSR